MSNEKMKSIKEIKATINKGQERINKLTEENHENDFSLEIAKATLDMAKNEFILAVTQGIPIDRLETICNAERKGRCMVLPCKVGNTLFTTTFGSIKQITVIAINVFSSISVFHIEITARNERMSSIPVEICNFGKTVFFTREEAEKALKEREQNG